MRSLYRGTPCCKRASTLGREARLESAHIAHSVDRFEAREQRNNHEREGYLGIRMCSEPGYCKKERPEDDKGCAIDVVGKDKFAHLDLV